MALMKNLQLKRLVIGAESRGKVRENTDTILTKKGAKKASAIVSVVLPSGHCVLT